MAPFSMDLFLPSVPSIKDQFGVPEETLQLLFSLYIWGFGFFQLFVGLLSDRFGRRPIFRIGAAVYALAGFGCALSYSFNHFLIFRVIQSLGACSGPITAVSITRDKLSGKERARVLSYIVSAMAIAPIIAPSVGAYLQEHFGWHSNFVFLATYGLALIFLSFALPETLEDKKTLVIKKVFKDYLEILSSKVWFRFSLMNAFHFAAFFTWISASSLYLIDRFHLSQFQFALFFGSCALLFMAGSLTNARLLKSQSMPKLISIGTFFFISGAISLYWFSWYGISPGNLWASVVGIAFGMGLVMPNSNSLALEEFKDKAGKATAMTNLIRLSSAGLSVWVTSHFYDSNARGIATAVLIFAFLQLFALSLGVFPGFRPKTEVGS